MNAKLRKALCSVLTALGGRLTARAADTQSAKENGEAPMLPAKR